MLIALPNYILCFILPLTLPHSRLDEVASLEQLEYRCCVCASERECAPLATLVFAHPTTQLDVQRKR